MISPDQLADSIPNVMETTTIDVLIGSDFFWEIVGGDKVVLPSGMFMLPSKFGYIVTDKCPEGDHDLPISTLFVSTVNFMLPGATSHCLSGTFEPVDKLWSLEIIGIADPMIESDDDLALHTIL